MTTSSSDQSCSRVSGLSGGSPQDLAVADLATGWPRGFDWKAAGVVLLPPDPAEATKTR
jgi:hypothetical protein